MAFLLLIAAATLAGPQPLRTLGDWTVGCDNLRDCKAVALDAEGGGGSILAIERGGGSDARPRLTLELRSEVGTSAILIDGRPQKIALSKEGELTGPDSLQLARQIGRARRIELADDSGRIISRVSAKGASAALRWLDDRQGRAGTDSAMAAMGGRRFAAAALALPRIVAAKASSKAPRRLSDKQIAAVRAASDCIDDEWVRDRRVAYGRLDAATSLALVPCLVGAYQSVSVAILLPEGGAYKVAAFDFPGQDNPSQLIDPEFKARGAELWSTYKGRGMGDCGGTDGWAWDGRAFRLIYRNRMDECRGSTDRITLWRSANHPQTEAWPSGTR